METRRGFVIRLLGVTTLGVFAGESRLLAQVTRSATPITVYKSSTCGCCEKWVEHLGENDFAPDPRNNEEMDQLKDELAVPRGVRSCHTALVGKYLIEGHVPAADIHRLLRERPPVAGLAVPGMPPRSPGMARPGEAVGDFEVVTFQLDGTTRVFSRH